MPLLQTFANASVRGFERFGPTGSLAAYELISTTVLGSSAASVTFSGLGTSAAAYKHLQIRVASRIGSANTGSYIYTTFNGDTGSNYSWHILSGNGSTVTSGATASTNSMLTMNVSGNSTSGMSSGAILDILDFSSTSKNKTMRTLSGFAISGTNQIWLASGAWYSTSAITSITITVESSRNFDTGSRFSIYGLR